MKELLPKISEAMNETFVGNYVFSDEELARIYDFTGCLLRNYDGGWGNSISQGYDQLVFVAMVNAVKTWKSDEDTFWDSSSLVNYPLMLFLGLATFVGEMSIQHRSTNHTLQPP